MSHLEKLENRVYIVRNQRVMLDSDLAEIYGVETRRLNEQFKRNESRFPRDFAFRLSEGEWRNLMHQIAVTRSDMMININEPNTPERGGRRKTPIVFTEHGAIMVSTILNGKRAVDASIFVVRAFVHFRQMMNSQELLAERITQLEDKFDGNFNVVFEALRELIESPPLPKQRKRIGYKTDNL